MTTTCHVCGGDHEMALTPFPLCYVGDDPSLWLCPYDATGKHTYRFRSGMFDEVVPAVLTGSTYDEAGEGW